MQYIKAMQEEASGKGELQINVTSTLDSHPIAEARISISYTGVSEQTLEQVTTDSSGQSEVLTLSHSAQSKELFAVGAVNAALFMSCKGPGLYDMSHLI